MTSRKLFALTLYLLLFAGCSGSDAVPEKEATTAAQENDRTENDSKSLEPLTDSPAVDHAQEGQIGQAMAAAQDNGQNEDASKSPEPATKSPVSDQPQDGKVAPAAPQASDEATKKKRIEALKWNIHSLFIYAGKYNKGFPRNIVSADGKPLMSWRVELLPVMTYGAIYEQLRHDEPWDSPHNAALLKQVDPRLFASNPDTPDGYADIQAVIGPGFGFSPTDHDQPNGIAVTDFAYGAHNTIMIVEVSPEKAVPWAKPDDYIWNPEKPTQGLGPKDKPYFLAAFGYFEVRAISKQESADTLKAAFDRANQTDYDLMPVEWP